MNATSAVLSARHLDYAYPGGTPLLRDVSLDLRRGEMLGLLGANGAGKSTILKILSGFLRPAAGEVFLAGKPLTEYSAAARARMLAVLPQSVTCAMPYTVAEIIRMGRFRRADSWLTPQDARGETVIQGLLDRFALTALRNQNFSRLSGGERQRTLLAAALAQEPQVLLLDEPTAALDLGHAAQLMSYLDELRREGLAVLVVSHDLALTAAWAERVTVLRDGGLAAYGRPAEVLTAEFIEATYHAAVNVAAAPDGGILVAPSGKNRFSANCNP